MEDRMLIAALLDTIKGGGQPVLCTVVDSQGSAPRGPGARMALLPDGVCLGTVGGGTVERLAQARASQLLAGKGTEGVELYSFGGGDAATGMVCGGTAQISFLRLDRGDLPALEKLSRLLEQGAPCLLVMRVTGEPPAISVYERGEVPHTLEGRMGRGPLLERGIYTEPLCRDGVLYLFGGGHVGQALAPMLAQVGFRVVVFDSRPELARPELFPGVERVVQGDFSCLAQQVQPTSRDYVVVMTPGHQNDLEVLTQVLPRKPFYVGCLGSRKKGAFLRSELARRGIAQEQIDAIRLPIGLDLGGETPAEIAVSVTAQLIQERARRLGGRKKGGCPA